MNNQYPNWLPTEQQPYARILLRMIKLTYGEHDRIYYSLTGNADHMLSRIMRPQGYVFYSTVYSTDDSEEARPDKNPNVQIIRCDELMTMFKEFVDNKEVPKQLTVNQALAYSVIVTEELGCLTST